MPGEEEALRGEKARAGQRGPPGGAERRGLRACSTRTRPRRSPAWPGLPPGRGAGRDRPSLPPLLDARAEAAARRSRTWRCFLRDYREALEVSPGRLDEIESAPRARRAAEEEVRRDGRGGPRLRRALPRASCDGLGSPEEREQASRRERERLAAGLPRRGARSSRRGAGPRRWSCEKRVRGRARAAGDGEDALPRSASTLATPEAAADRAAVDGARPRAGRVPALAQPRRGAAPAGPHRLRRRAVPHHAGAQVRRCGRRGRGRRSSSTRWTPGSGAAWPRWSAASCRPIAARQQVLCVTHLPQIAALADQHFAVRKQRGEGAAPSPRSSALGRRARVEEIARMLGGETITEPRGEHAREMVKQGLRALRSYLLHE